MTAKKILWSSLVIAFAVLLVVALCRNKSAKGKAPRYHMNKNIVQKF